MVKQMSCVTSCCGNRCKALLTQNTCLVNIILLVADIIPDNWRCFSFRDFLLFVAHFSMLLSATHSMWSRSFRSDRHIPSTHNIELLHLCISDRPIHRPADIIGRFLCFFYVYRHWPMRAAAFADPALFTDRPPQAAPCCWRHCKKWQSRKTNPVWQHFTEHCSTSPVFNIC